MTIPRQQVLDELGRSDDLWAARLGPRALPALAELLAGPDEQLAGRAARVAGAIGGADGAATLRASSRDSRASIRVATAGAAGALPEPAASEVLLPLLDDQGASVRKAALQAASPGATPELRARILELLSKDAAVRPEARAALWRIGATASTGTGRRLNVRRLGRIAMEPPPAVQTVFKPLAVAADASTRIFVAMYALTTDPSSGAQNETRPGFVAVMDDQDRSVERYIQVGPATRYLAVDPGNGRVFVTHNDAAGTLAVIDGASAEPQVLGTPLSLKQNLAGVAINARTRRAYVATNGRTVFVVDVQSLKVLGQILLDTSLQIDRLAVDEATNRVYVPGVKGGEAAGPYLYVIDGETHAWVKVSLQHPLVGAARPRAVALNPETGRIYVANFSSNANSVSVLEHPELAGPPRLITTVGLSGRLTPHLAIGLWDNLVYVANNTGPMLGSVGIGMTVLDGATNAIFTLPADLPSPDPALKLGAWSVAVAPGSRRIYLANPDDGGVSVVEVEG